MSAEKLDTEVLRLLRRGYLSRDPDAIREIVKTLEVRYSAWKEAANLIEHAKELERQRAVTA